MQKKLLAVAVAGALGAPALAHAQASTVQVFGTFYTEYAFINQGRSPVAGAGDRTNLDMLQTPGSEIGFKGEEKLGGGLSAWFQCTSTADTRGQSQDGWCSRNSAVGVKGAFGNVFVGNWDLPFKRVFGVNRISNETGVWGDSFLMAGGSTTTNGSANPAEFIRRQSNSIHYESPAFSGFKLMLATNATTTSTANLASSPIAKPRLWSFGGTYNNGPLNLGLAYEQHKDFDASRTAGRIISGTDKAWLLSAGYVWGPVKLGAMYTQQKFDTAPNVAGGANTDLKVDAWQVAADWTISGPHGLRAAYTRANDTKGSYIGNIGGSGSTRVGNNGAGDTGARLWQISYVHTFSKRTEGTFGYSRLNNDSKAIYSLGGLSSPAAGESQRAWGVSMKHRF